MARVVMYATEWCPYCRRAEALLRAKGAQIETIDVEAQPERRAEMQRRSRRHTVPQIWIGATHVGGCDDLYALERDGKLEPLLAAE
ncbi:MAG: glutaredoxin 3 [Burkholderiales bacterium]